MLKGKIVLGTFLAFLEVFIWFLIAREALLVSVDSIWIPISYSLGYATGTFLGSFMARKFLKGCIGLQIIIDASKQDLLQALKLRGYKLSLVKLESIHHEDQLMIFLTVNARSVKKILSLIQKSDPDAFISISDTKQVLNGILK